MGSNSVININTNIASLNCQKNLGFATKNMNKAMERLTTGFKLNSASDNAADYSIAASMESCINGFDIIKTNAQIGMDMLTTAEGVLDIINSYLQRIRDLTMQAANGTYGSQSMNAIKTEVSQRMDEINRLSNITNFNDTYLLDGSRQDDINLQVGLYSNDRSVIKLDSFLFASAMCTTIMGFRSAKDSTDKAPGYVDLRTSDTESDEYRYRARYIDSDGKPTDADGNLLPTNGSTPVFKDGYYASALAAALAENNVVEFTGGANAEIVSGAENFTIDEMCDAIYRNDNSARAFLDNIDKAINNVSLRCTNIGAYMNRLDSAIDTTSVQHENLTEALSTLRDSDAAAESSNYIKYQILQQASATLLATANQQPQIALNLI